MKIIIAPDSFKDSLSAQGVADAIVGLNQDLQQVSKIAQVINQVAERSDLLALNAALEGTKAGEVGRGFSLVAAEMRKLAENVSASARDIARIVEKVQDSGEEAASKARVGMATSDRGVEVAEQASSVFQRIVELARGTSEAARQITIATRQQRQSSEQAVQGARNVAEAAAAANVPALDEWLGELRPVLDQVYGQRNCGILIARDAVVAFNPAMDITGALGNAGIELPKTFDIKGIVKLLASPLAAEPPPLLADYLALLASFNPTIPARISPTHTSRATVAGSWNSTMPSTTVPIAPMPVHTA